MSVLYALAVNTYVSVIFAYSVLLPDFSQCYGAEIRQMATFQIDHYSTEAYKSMLVAEYHRKQLHFQTNLYRNSNPEEISEIMSFVHHTPI
jgi:hypothetical protein